MLVRNWSVLLLLIFALPLAALAEPPGQALLSFARGQLPNDLGTAETKVSLSSHEQLGTKVLKVELANSFGDSPAKVKNWLDFDAVRFQAFNPSEQPVKLELNVRHEKSKDYPTRVVVPFTLKPGKNEVRLPIASMRNVNKSVGDLGHVVRWYINLAGKPARTLYFGEIVLEGSDKPRPTAAVIKLTGDPARLERIRAAKMPPIDGVVLFHTPEADAICSALEVFPPDNPWNLVVDNWPLHPNSKAIVASIGLKKPLRYNPDMSFIIVPPNQKKVDLLSVRYKDESDRGPYPIPDNIPIEGWPANFQRSKKSMDWTLDDVQRDKAKEGGDRHALVVDPTNRKLYEFYTLKKTDAGWMAAQASIFDLGSNKMRPETWTSADAAGLPIFPSVVRYDELQRGAIEHALRVTVVRSRRAYVYPARHFASKLTDESLPRMGERLRLRKDFEIKGFSPEVTAILKCLQKYGMFVADNGIDWAISVAPDPRIPVLHPELRRVQGSDFEVVVPPAGYQPPEG